MYFGFLISKGSKTLNMLCLWLSHASAVSSANIFVTLAVSTPDAAFSDNWAVKMGRTGTASMYAHVLLPYSDLNCQY